MERDFLKDLELLGVTARLKRLSDELSTSIKSLYKKNGLDIESGWHLFFLILLERQEITMVEIANELHLSQPAVTKMVNRMQKKGYLEVNRDEVDSRKKNLTLSKKALNELPKFKKVWNAGKKSIRDILASNESFLPSLEKFEIQITKMDFENRATEYLKND